MPVRDALLTSGLYIAGEGGPYIFIAKLIGSQMDRSEGPAPDLLSDHILVDVVLRRPVVLARGVFGAGIECFLLTAGSVDQSVNTEHVEPTFTGRLALGFRCRCLWGLSKECADLWPSHESAEVSIMPRTRLRRMQYSRACGKPYTTLLGRGGTASLGGSIPGSAEAPTWSSYPSIEDRFLRKEWEWASRSK